METVIKPLVEAASLASEAPAADGTWKVRIISEGRGSSGVYTGALLEQYGHAFSNSLSFKNHPLEGPHERDFTMITGRILGDVEVVTESNGGKAVYGRYLPDPEYAEKLERYKDQLGLSIYISGTGSIEESTGDFIVESFDESDPFKSVDVVIAPGRDGRFLESMKRVYSAQTEVEKRTVTEAGENGSKNMELEAKVDKALELLAALATDKAEKAAEAAQVTADAEAAKVAAEGAVAHYSAAVEAVDAADLFESQRKDILAQAAKGEDVSALIESAKTVKAEALEAVKESAEQDGTPGVVLGESATKFGAWA